MRSIYIIIFACLSCLACSAQEQKEKKLLLVAKHPIVHYERMVAKLNMYEEFSFVRPLKISSTNGATIISWIHFDPICDFYETHRGGFLNRQLAINFLRGRLDENPLALYDVLITGDTLCVLVRNELNLINFNSGELISKSQIPINDNAGFHNDVLYTTTSGKILSTYSLNGKLITKREFAMYDLSGEIYFHSANAFVFDDVENSITSISLDSLSTTHPRMIMRIPANLYLMDVNDEYFVCGNKNVDNSAVKTNELTFISRSSITSIKRVTLDTAVLNDLVLNKPILKENVDGAPEPVSKPYWRICSDQDDYFITFQANREMLLYKFQLDK
jgi:hypothetical protein